jgi:uncharacterized damage-inducible protein DinB
MALIDALLPEFDHEMTVTRKLLERVPEDKFDWKPHAKSTSLGDLATHIANIAFWGEITLDKSEIDLAGGGRAQRAKSRADLLATFDKNVATTRAILARKGDGELMERWSLKNGARTFFTMPKAAVWRTFVMNHLIHHRAQLSVYLRMHDVPLPAMYGPSADENPF